ncbi:response regulator transcription factor [Pedosphaera parvula]|uniref:Response regulator receiver protein n=1 Tax=Pedosphaera parvula (strain Ellin514) TaxID=320771 RepID=B9XDL7_PEDPL|nr:response regulator transcription factor [Pedosphaera parvula]EEF62163.1 response regulator receiver protein [Pedosphaera parvula Ellin514]
MRHPSARTTSGASGYLLKRMTSEKLLDAINEARLGGVPLTRQMADKAAHYFQPIETAKSALPNLTRREQQTLALLAEFAATRKLPTAWASASRRCASTYATPIANFIAVSNPNEGTTSREARFDSF